MKGVPPVGTRVLVEVTVVHLNAGEWAWPRDKDAEGPLLPIPCVKVREGILFGVRVEDLEEQRTHSASPKEAK